MKKIKRHISSEEEGKIIGSKIKKKKATRTNVYFNKKKPNGEVKYLSGKFYSKKNKEHFIYRSSYELKCFLTLEEDPTIVSFISETLSIPYKDSYNKARVYIPDLLVLSDDGSLCVWEIKPKEMLKDIDVQKKAEACKKYLRDNFPEVKIGYKFITEDLLFASQKEYSSFVYESKKKDFSRK